MVLHTYRYILSHVGDLIIVFLWHYTHTQMASPFILYSLFLLLRGELLNNSAAAGVHKQSTSRTLGLSQLVLS